MYVLSPSGEHLCVITENLEHNLGNRFICSNISEGRVHFSVTSVDTSDAGVYKWTESSPTKTFGTIFTLFVTGKSIQRVYIMLIKHILLNVKLIKKCWYTLCKDNIVGSLSGIHY